MARKFSSNTAQVPSFFDSTTYLYGWKESLGATGDFKVLTDELLDWARGGFTEGSVPFAGANGQLTEENANLFYDTALDNFGVGTNTPAAKIHAIGADALDTTEVLRIDGTGGEGWSFRADNTQYFEGAPMLYVRSDAGRERLIFAFEAAAEGAGSVGTNGSFMGYGINNVYGTSGGATSQFISGIFGTNNTVNNTPTTGGNYAFGDGNSVTGEKNMSIGYNNSISSGIAWQIGRDNNHQSATSNYKWFQVGNNISKGGTLGGPNMIGCQIGHDLGADQGVINSTGLFLIGSDFSISATGYDDDELIFDTAKAGADPAGFHFAAAGRNVLSIGQRTTNIDASASHVLAMLNGIAPTTSPADTLQLYSTDLSAGNTMLGIRTEGTPLGVGTPTQDTTVAVEINGTTYYLLASTSAT